MTQRNAIPFCEKAIERRATSDVGGTCKGALGHDGECRPWRFRATYLEPKSEPAPVTDAVNHPPHYATGFGGVEVIALTRHLNFCRGNAVKYLCRAGRKAGSDELEDLRKARWYLDDEIARLEKERGEEK